MTWALVLIYVSPTFLWGAPPYCERILVELAEGRSACDSRAEEWNKLGDIRYRVVCEHA
jgi:hypothetical protein